MVFNVLLVGQANKYASTFSHMNSQFGWKIEIHEVADIITEIEKSLNRCIDMIIINAKLNENFWQLVRNIKTDYKNLEIIILSEVPDFKIAYQAFQNRVTQFLLEPVEDESWANIIREMEEKHLIMEVNKEKEQKLMSFELNQHQKLMAKIMTHMMDKPEDLAVMMGEINERYHMHLKNTYYFAVQLVVLDLMETSQKKRVLNQIQGMFEEKITLANEVVVSSQIDFDLRVIINVNWNHLTSEIIEQFRMLEEEIALCLSKLRIYNWAMGFGPVVGNLQGIQSSVQSSIQTLHDWNLKKKGHVFLFHLTDYVKEKNEILDSINRKQCQIYLRQFNIKELESFLNDFINKYMSNPNANPYDIHILVMEVLELAYGVWKNHFDIRLLENILCKDIFMYIYDNQKKVTYLIRMLTSLVEKVEDQPSHSISPQIRDAINYIHENYKQGLTLYKVALKVDLSPNYFSNLFCEEMRMNYVNYVTEYKLKISKQLLEEKDWTIEQIANEIGYQDVKYFSQLFKRHYKIT